MISGERPAILGLDLGTKTGWALLSTRGVPLAWGVWNLDKLARKITGSVEPRFLALQECLRPYAQIPYVGFENVQFAYTSIQAHLWGGFRAVVAVTLRPKIWVPVGVSQLKKWATGRGDASKAAMVNAALGWLKLHDAALTAAGPASGGVAGLQEDAADALLVAKHTWECVCGPRKKTKS